MKFSYVMLPDYPLEESMRAIKLADELGFYACYAADETWHKDLWLLFAAAARDTTNIRLDQASGVVLREPTLIAQAAATLDEAHQRSRRSGPRIRKLRPAVPIRHQLGRPSRCPASRRAFKSSGHCSTTARLRSTATSSSTTGCSPSRGQSRSGCRSRSGPCGARSRSRSRVSSLTVATTALSYTGGPTSMHSSTSAPVPRGLGRTQTTLTSQPGW